MRTVRLMVAAMLFSVVAYPFLANAHGGGCRKSSPPGQCCHMDKKKGYIVIGPSD